MQLQTARLKSSLPLCPIASNALNIIVNNDDGFGSANIREFYRLLKAAGHNAWIVAPVINQSSRGGTTVFTTEAKLTSPSQYDIYTGTPAACTFFALDYVVPNFWNGTKVDLLVAGPNFGGNAGAFLYTLSGRIGATYAAVERSIPAIAFSAGNGEQRGYKEINATTASDYADPATIDARLSVDLVNQLAKNGNASQLLPYGYGLNVNYPEITSLTDSSCVSPPFIQTRMTGGAIVDKVALNETTGLFTYGELTSIDSNTCINGDCSLPAETTVVEGGCFSSVTVFTVDYHAPNCAGSANVRPLLQPLVQFQNLTSNSTKAARSANTRYVEA